MRLRVVAVGMRMPAWVKEGTRDYLRRLPPEYRFEITEIAPIDPRRGADRAVREEGERLLAAIAPRERVVCLAIEGERLSTEDLALRLERWQREGRDVAFVIGGPEGLSPACLERAELRWSLSPLTFPHALVRVIVAEQIYRAWSILAGHPYHRS